MTFHSRVTVAAGWLFEIGKCVSHKTQAMPSVVATRIVASNGTQVYGVRSYADVDDNRDRIILGSALISVRPGDKPCLSCLLYKKTGCPGKAQ